MTPSELQLAIGPVLARMKPGRCLCSNRLFRKTISFDFRDYEISPTALADSEILISNVLRDKRRYQWVVSESGSTFTCLTCESVLVETYEEFSISMSQSTIAWDEKSTIRGNYVVGFYGFTGADFARIVDFDPVGLNDYLTMLGFEK